MAGIEAFKLLVQASWPLVILLVLSIFYRDIKKMLRSLLSRIESDESIKLGAVEFRGARIRGERQAKEQGADVFDEKSGVETREATLADFERRKSQRYASQFVRLVHRVVPTGNAKYPLKVLVYVTIEKILPGLNQDRGYKPARINDIDFVEYYLGKYYGPGEWGNWFIVRNGEDKFAIEYFAEDEVNCVARVHFHDKTEVELLRYLDLEMGNIVLDMERLLKIQDDNAEKKENQQSRIS